MAKRLEETSVAIRSTIAGRSVPSDFSATSHNHFKSSRRTANPIIRSLTTLIPSRVHSARP